MKNHARLKNVIYHTIFTLAIILTIVSAVFVFPRVFFRFLDGVTDFIDAFLYYFRNLMSVFTGEELPTAKVTEIPSNAVALLPWTWEEFTEKVSAAWSLLWTGENFSGYMLIISNGLLRFSLILTFALTLSLPLLLFALINRNSGNNNYNADTRALKIHKRIAGLIYAPIVAGIRGLKNFLYTDKGKYYRYALIVLWLYNLNFLTIVAECLAYLIYFVTSFDVLHIYTQVAKLTLDLSVSLTVVPTPLKIVFGWLIFDRVRCWVAENALRDKEKRDEEFIKSLSVATFVKGTMGTGKTMQLTSMAYLYEKIMRDEAKDGVFRNDMRFPNFPWINFENKIKELQEKHLIYNKATARKFVRLNEDYFRKYSETITSSDEICRRQFIDCVLPHWYDMRYIDVDFFGYDWKKYGTEYDDGLYGIDLFRVLEYYAEYYFVYALNCSEILSNYSIRWDYESDDAGNFPLWRTDCFREQAKDSGKRRYSKILDFDMLRLGKTVKSENPMKDVFEFGSVAITEIGKERGNQNTQTAERRAETANQKNDYFNWEIRLGRHPGTVEYSTFFKLFVDDQRLEDWEASGSSLCDWVHIRKSSFKIGLAFFHFEELIYQIITPIFEKMYYNTRHKRGDNTLTLYLAKKLYVGYANYYLRRRNIYGLRVQKMQVKRQGENAEDKPKDEKYYILSRSTYGRYRSDAYAGVFATKAERSAYGLADVPEYAGDCATWAEYKEQNSFLIATIAEAIVKEEEPKATKGVTQSSRTKRAE